MKIVRVLCWLAALSPALAAAWWASFGARFPEPSLDRRALGEVTQRWSFAEWADVQSEPAHFVARLLHLGALEVPGATIASVAWVNALLAVLIVSALATLMQRTFALEGIARQVNLAVAGLLVASPAFGADWLHGERAGALLPPLLLLTALSWLQRERLFALRGFGAILLAALAPFCHSHGVLVFLALLPALAAAARRAGSGRGPALVVACLLVGNVAAAISLRSAGAIADGCSHWIERLGAAPGATLDALLRATGSSCLDLLPATTCDQLLIGALCWLLPLVLWRLGDRSDAARATAAPWWSCVWFGLLLVVWNALRYDLEPPVGTLREAMFGAFLLPAGAAGVLAARCGRVLLPVLAGGLAVLALQDWHDGIEKLRLARMRVERIETSMVLPEAFVGPRPANAGPAGEAAELALLRASGWVPLADEALAAALPAAFSSPPSPSNGSCSGGDLHAAQGTVRSSLRHDTVQWVVVLARVEPQAPIVVGFVQPEVSSPERDVPWRVEFKDALPEGACVRALGYQVRSRTVCCLGPLFVMQDGVLVERNGL